jgi:hypothetical protein
MITWAYAPASVARRAASGTWGEDHLVVPGFDGVVHHPGRVSAVAA